MSSDAPPIDMEAGDKVSTRTQVSTDRPGLVRWIAQPIVCIVIAAAALLYVHFGDLSVTERRSLNRDTLLTLLRQHMSISLISTALVCIIAIPVGIALTRGPMRRYSKPVMTVAGFGQAAPAIGLIAISAEIFGFGATGVIIAMLVYGVLPIVANTVAGIDSVDPKLVEAGRGMGMSAASTLVRVELPLALPIIVAGVRTALVLIVGTVSLATFVGAGGLGAPINTGITLGQKPTLLVGAVLVAALALFIDWLARLVEMAVAPKGLK